MGKKSKVLGEKCQIKPQINEENASRVYKLREWKLIREGQKAEDEHNKEMGRPYRWKERKEVKERQGHKKGDERNQFHKKCDSCQLQGERCFISDNRN